MTATTDGGPGATMRGIWGALGLFFTFITAKVLLADVTSYTDLKTDHLLTVGALVGAVVAGVFFGPLLRRGKVIAALGLALSFSAATVYCLIGSAGRGDELAYEKNAEARKTNEIRKRYERDRTEAKARWDTALASEADECKSGPGIRCKGRAAFTAQARSAFEVADLLVRQAGPEAREDGKLRRAAELWVLARGGDVEAAQKGLALLWPFLPPAICELLAIIFWHQALARKHAWTWQLPNWQPRREYPRLPSPTVTDAVPVTAQTTVASVVADPVSVSGNRPKPKRQRPTDIKLVHDAIERLGGVAESQDQLAEAMLCHKSEAHKRIQACGDFVVVEKVGKCNRVRINTAFDYI